MEVLEKVEDFGDDLTDTTLIPVEDYCPIFPSNFAPSTGVIIAGKQLRVPTRVATPPRSVNGCLKRPKSANSFENIHIQTSPSTTAARYVDGRVTGLCFTKYSTTRHLWQAWNPNLLRKGSVHVQSNGLLFSSWENPHHSSWLDGVKKGIRHLH
ncbi:hypothetical protein GX50_03552 [[Emmonsia] crescens]|uniref:Uncharacterized protein n=1 Tax=[Emmonsia] crescens TaxID=73230 RepID=A0A2B7ZKX1_9EURO|nr:hypothetical protein GX50_03552 [Emmonsia crescens]